MSAPCPRRKGREDPALWFLDEGGKLQREAGAVPEARCWMPVSGDFEAVGGDFEVFEVAVMEEKFVLLMPIGEGSSADGGGAVMISPDQHEGWREALQMVEEGVEEISLHSAMHEIAGDDEGVRSMVSAQVGETFLEAMVSPKRKESSRFAHGERVAVVGVGHSEPFLLLVDESKAAIEKDPRSHFGLGRLGARGGGHDRNDLLGKEKRATESSSEREDVEPLLSA